MFFTSGIMPGCFLGVANIRYCVVFHCSIMKQYRIDGLDLQDHRKLKTYLDTHLGTPMLGNIYWLELESSLLTPLQKDHEACAPHCFALELEETFLSCEFLVRIKKSIRCDCMGYATPLQREWLISTVDAILETLSITA
ncbi:hypothetical protein JCM12294_01280 [Desulfocicer niacini]